MVEPIYCLKPAWCGRHLAGLRPETGLTVRYGATAFKAVGYHIYNGAADNATGCGVLLELAYVFTHAGVSPPHSTIFAAVTAEEQGLLGSEYLGLHPPI